MRIDTDALYERAAKLAEFTVTDEHLLLLRNAYVQWSDVEFGAPEIDGKRPYGNSSVLEDIAELLSPGWAEDLSDAAIERWMDANEERLATLHAETAIVLQIALQVGEFKTGRYRKVRWQEWVAADADA